MIVIVESPYAGDIERNKEYLKKAILDCISRGETPFASHAFYTQFLDDNVPEQRELGIKLGFAFRRIAEKTVVYQDFGITYGMDLGIQDAKKLDQDIEYREIL